MNEGELARGLQRGLEPLVKAIREHTEMQEKKGCSCGMADYGEPGHDGDALDGAIQDLRSELIDKIEDVERSVEEVRDST